MSRCWGCCQENCGYSQCSCSCHESERGRAKVQEVKARPSIIDTSQRCERCGAFGAHYCIGKRETGTEPPAKWYRDLVKASMESAVHGCSEHTRYRAKRKPRANCESCWRMWIALNPG